MNFSRKRSWKFLMMALFIAILAVGHTPAVPQTQPVNESVASVISKTQQTIPTESDKSRQGTTAPLAKIDHAGEKLGQQVESLADRASGLIGDWINVKLIAGISLLKLIFCFLLLLALVVFERLVRAVIERRKKAIAEIQAPKNVKDHIIEAVGRPLGIFIWAYGVYIVLTPLFAHFRMPDGTNLVQDVVGKAADLCAAVALIWFIFRLVDAVDLRLRQWAATTESTIDDMLAPLLGKTLRVFIVVIGAVLVIQNLTGVEIGPLLASLGVGGIAVALAAKDSIANFFGTLTILFDKPFQVGQRVVIDNTDGTIEDVGFRSTRIRTLTGHLVTIPNEKLVNTPIENIAARPHIRWLNNITITYDTPPEKVEKAVAILRELLDNHEGMHPDFPPRVYFNGFNEWSLNILMVAWYHPPDYWKMQEWQQRTCLEILGRFNDEGIEFAFPSQTVYVAGDDARQLKLRMLKGDVETVADSAGERKSP